VCIPGPLFGKNVFVLHDDIKVKPQEDSHPGLSKLVVSPLDKTLCQCADKVHKLVGLPVVAR
jgi:hypothetical protein